jgi:hypothetical protein
LRRRVAISPPFCHCFRDPRMEDVRCTRAETVEEVHRHDLVSRHGACWCE